jgi:adenylosuccinate lyase
VRRGVGREQAHEAIKAHAVAVALALREGAAGNDLVDRLAGDARLGLDRAEIDAVLADRVGFVGTAPHQVAAFVAQVEAVAAAHPEAARYRPEPIL